MRVLMRSVVANLLLVSPVAAQTYEPTILPPQIVGSPATMTPLQLGDDNTAKIDLGFEFTYWGQTFTSAWVSSNGFVSFQGGNHLCCNGYQLEQSQRNTIYGFWTDLVSYNGNPYYSRKQGSILFGWYNTSEYGTQNNYTFEIGLKDDNSIQFNYGAMPNLTYHYATAGITGPESGDNIQLFYGRNASLLSFQSGALTLPVKQVVDCAATPLDPSCPPQAVTQTQTITTPIIETIQEAYAADVQVDRAEQLAASEPEPAQEIAVVETQTETASVTDQVAESVAAERLTPDQVLALAAPATDGLSLGGGFMSFSTLNALSTGSPASSSSVLSPVESVTSTSSPSSVANTLEVLNMASAPTPMSTAQTEQTSNTMSAGQVETMEAIAAVPGFSAYAKVSLQDRPDFYAPRDIYKNRRLRDANFEMYVITNSNTRKWQEMVDAQYER